MRRFFVSIALACTLTIPAAAAQSVADRLADLRDKARPVIVLSDTPDDPRVARQIGTLERTRSGLGERNIVILQEARPDSALRKILGVAAHGFAVVLVGKDGSVKKIWRAPVDPQAIFTLIDAMPMRREQMKG